jgi:hypothetical protein
VEGTGRSILRHLPSQIVRIRSWGSTAGTSSESNSHLQAIFLSKFHPNIIVKSTHVSEVICKCLSMFLICILHTPPTELKQIKSYDTTHYEISLILPLDTIKAVNFFTGSVTISISRRPLRNKVRSMFR